MVDSGTHYRLGPIDCLLNHACVAVDLVRRERGSRQCRWSGVSRDVRAFGPDRVLATVNVISIVRGEEWVRRARPGVLPT